MSKRIGSVAALVVTVLATSPVVARAQAQAQPAPITVTFYNAPLRDVLQGLAAYSGKTIIMKAAIGNPAINASFRNVEWRDALDQILKDQQLVLEVDPKTGILVIRKHPPDGGHVRR